MSRQRSPAPPTLPPKDSSSSLSSTRYHNHNPTQSSSSSPSSSQYINTDLAEAVRDSVQFGSKQPPSPLLDFSDPTGYKHPSRPTSTSLNPGIPPLPRRTPSPRLHAPHSSNDLRQGQQGDRADRMSYIVGQPQLPSQRIISAQNPFESDEIEPPPGPIRPPGARVGDGRGKLARAQTSTSGTTTTSTSSANLLQTSPVAKTRPRRSMSSGSYGLDANGRELTAGQKKAVEDKKAGKHADVIDTWDPTGLGSAMWHHAGPYDAAAPSRNQNQPQAKAPMRAFNAKQAAMQTAQAAVQPPSGGASAIPAPARTGTAISLASPPIPPAKDNNDGPTRRAQAALDRKPTSATRRTSGGLTGQYSTSMPSSGGYFPDMAAEPTDEAELARRERQRQREDKRRALKAAWGTDTPEPFEDFGVSPSEGNIELADDMYSPDSGTVPLPGGRPARSPGLRNMQGAPPILEDVVSPYSETAGPTAYRAPAPQAGGGVKRTKSLMQKIKTMRDSHNRSPLRAQSPKADPMPTSPSKEIVSPMDRAELAGSAPGGRKSFFGRSTSPKKPAYTMAFEDDTPLPEVGDFVFVESPEKKTRAATASRTGDKGRVEQDVLVGNEPIWGVPTADGGTDNLMETLQDTPLKEVPGVVDGYGAGGARNGAGAGSDGLGGERRAKNRTKNLPTPPVMPVYPDFDDLLPTRTMSRGGDKYENGGEGVKRKASMVKKLKDRIK